MKSTASRSHPGAAFCTPTCFRAAFPGGTKIHRTVEGSRKCIARRPRVAPLRGSASNPEPGPSPSVSVLEKVISKPARGTGKYVTALSVVSSPKDGAELALAASSSTTRAQMEEGLGALGPLDGVVSVLKAGWFPQGWPTTVTEEYARYAFWNTGRNAFRKANYVLGTTALLYALGLGAKTSATLSATLNWLLKDGLGMMSKVSASTQISRVLDKDPKLFRMTGDCLMVVSVLVELLAPLHPSLFLVFGSLASLLIQVADAFSGPAYRVFLNSMAINDNIGDVSSRGDIHVVFGNLIGLAVGAAASIWIDQPTVQELGFSREVLLSALFVLFSIGHLATCRMEISVVQLRTLNRKRTDIIFNHFVNNGEVPSIVDTNKREPLAPSFGPDRIVVGAPVHDFAPLGTDAEQTLARRGDRYLLGYNEDGTVGIMLEESCTDSDILKAMLEAEYLLWRMDGNGNDVRDSDELPEDHIGRLLAESEVWASDNFAGFQKSLAEKGWISHILFGTGKSRYREAPIPAEGGEVDSPSVR